MTDKNNNEGFKKEHDELLHLWDIMQKSKKSIFDTIHDEMTIYSHFKDVIKAHEIIYQAVFSEKHSSVEEYIWDMLSQYNEEAIPDKIKGAVLMFPKIKNSISYRDAFQHSDIKDEKEFFVHFMLLIKSIFFLTKMVEKDIEDVYKNGTLGFLNNEIIAKLNQAGIKTMDDLLSAGYRKVEPLLDYEDFKYLCDSLSKLDKINQFI
jgi:hypothetical protein